MKTTERRRRAARWLRGSGIEIGALHNPLEIPAGVSVKYVDRLTVDELRHHYPELAAEPLVEVDLIGDAEHLQALPVGSQDFVIANHLLEHLEDPLRGLAEMTRVLRPGGILYIALPDPRLTFDRTRELTTVDHVVSEYLHGPGATREAHYADWVDHAEPLVAWLGAADSDARPARVRELMATSYSIHFHVWRSETFLEVVDAARREAGVALELVEFSTTRPGEDDEFIFVFAKDAGETPPLPPRDPELVRLETRLKEQSMALEACRAQLQSSTFRVAARCQAAVRRAAPPGTARRRATIALARWLSPSARDRPGAAR